LGGVVIYLWSSSINLKHFKIFNKSKVFHKKKLDFFISEHLF